ncbi:hypothetical protein V490_09073, partial [Pseudogymnoascus sp. VKM F-3557]
MLPTSHLHDCNTTSFKRVITFDSTSQLGTYIAHPKLSSPPPNFAQRGPFATAPTQAQEALAHTRNQP